MSDLINYNVKAGTLYAGQIVRTNDDITRKVEHVTLYEQQVDVDDRRKMIDVVFICGASRAWEQGLNVKVYEGEGMEYVPRQDPRNVADNDHDDYAAHDIDLTTARHIYPHAFDADKVAKIPGGKLVIINEILRLMRAADIYDVCEGFSDPHAHLKHGNDLLLDVEVDGVVVRNEGYSIDTYHARLPGVRLMQILNAGWRDKAPPNSEVISSGEHADREAIASNQANGMG